MEILAGLGFWSGALLCLPSGFLLCEVLCGLRRRPPLPAGRQPLSAVILIPAHDEGAGIGRTLERLTATGTAGLRVLVVADNCTDSTAQIARDAGAEVLERTDPVRRGKPHALEWALDRLAAHPPEVVVFLDADCWFVAGTPSQLAAQALTAMRPVQCVYVLEGGGLGAFAFRLRNEARLRGLAALGAPVQLTGSGFAIPWDVLRQVPVPLGELAEDAVWGWSFCRAGAGARLAAEVVVGSSQPLSREGARVQSRRWEHGILSAALHHLPALLRSALLPPRWGRMLHLFDVLIPPLSLLILLAAIAAALAWAGSGARAMIPAALALAMTGAAVVIGWMAYGRSHLPFRALLLAPFHAVKKAGLYAGFLFRRERRWVPTRRDPGEPGS